MSRYKSFRGRNSGGAGVQFDKLLKVCSNSKKANPTKSIGSIGRFGLSSNSSSSFNDFSNDDFDISSKKRLRLDLGKTKSSDPFESDPFSFHGQSEIIMKNAPLIPPQPPVFKPKKFFKSRNPVEFQESPPEEKEILPPLLTTPKKRGRKPKNQQQNNVTPKPLPFTPAKERRRKEQTLKNTTNVSPPDTSPNKPIKLRIFKDKKTSKLVSVSEGPPNLEEQPVVARVAPRGRGRPPKQIPEEKKPKRGTRQSKRHRNSDSSLEAMPVLSRAQSIDEPLEDSDEESQFLPPPQNNSNSFVKGKKFEEDAEFQKLSEILSSMEEGDENDTSGSSKVNEPFFPPAEPVNLPQPKVTDPHDIRSILEDDWDDTFEEESGKKSLSPPKMSRFDMSIFGEKKTHLNQHEEIHHQHQQQNQHQQQQEQLQQQQQQLQQQQQQLQQQQQQNTSSQFPHQGQNYGQQNYDNFDARASGTSGQQFGSEPTPFNTSYAVRNLLNYPQPHYEGDEIPPMLQDIQTEVHKEVFDQKEGIHTAPIPTKKASIFKSRAHGSKTAESGEPLNPKKRLALYKHKFEGQEEVKEVQPPNRLSSESDLNDLDFNEEPDLTQERYRVEGNGSFGAPETVNKVLCRKEAKKLFTVVKNVKAIHELQESGEFHEFDGDVWYILEDLKDKNSITSRCLSAISLAMRCMEPAFRMHLRAHGTVSEFCKELRDAPTNPALSMLAATVLFVLSQDRLNMDLDTESLMLIIALAKTSWQPMCLDDNAELLKHSQRVIDLCTEMKARGHAKHLKLERITASELALETLLYLTSKRAGEWVKHELRSLGGLDFIVTEVGSSMRFLYEDLLTSGWFSEVVIERLWKIDRCLRVLQQVTFNHEENNGYLLGRGDTPTPPDSPAIFISIFRFCYDQLSLLPRGAEPASVLREILFSALRVLVNLSHDYRGIVMGSEILGSVDHFIDLTLHSVFHLTSKFPDEKIFDLLMHSFCLLLNLVEHSKTNREVILNSKIRRIQGDDEGYSGEEEFPCLEALVQLFLGKERSAKKEEASTDDILTKGPDQDKGKDKDQSQQSTSQSSQEKETDTSSVQDTIDKLIQTAGKHMENSLIAAYISLLLAYLIMDEPMYIEKVRWMMPEGKYLPLMIFLKKLFNFMSITSSASGSTRGLKATAIALKFYGKCDPGSNEELKKIIPD